MSVAPLSRERTPDHPGPGPLPEAFLRAVDLQIGRRLDGLLTGEHRTAALGMGTELAQIREWVPGDDVRRIDWNATARSNEVQVRVDVAERALTSWVLLTSPRRCASGPPTGESGTSPRGSRLRPGTWRRAGGTGSEWPLSARLSRSCCLPARAASGYSRSCSPFAVSPRPSGSGRRRSGALFTQIAEIARQRSLVVVVSELPRAS